MVEPPPIQQRVRDAQADRPQATWVQIAMIIGSAAIVPGILIAAAMANGVKDPEAVGRGIGTISCWYSGIVIITVIVWAATRARSLWPMTITFVATMLLFASLFGVGFGVGMNRAQSAKLWRELDRLNTQTLAEVRQAAESGNGDFDIQGILARHSKEMDRLGQGLRGNDAIAMKVGAGFATDMATIEATYMKSFVPFKKAGGMTPESLKDKEAVTKRRRLLKSAITVQSTILSSIELIPDDLHNRFAKLGASDAESRKLGDSMLKGMRFPKLLRIQRMERDLLALLDAHLADLEARWPKWKSKNGIFEFNAGFDAKALEAFNERVRKMQDLAQQQEAVRQELINPPAGQ